MRILWLQDVFDPDLTTSNKMATLLRTLRTPGDSISAAFYSHQGDVNLNTAFHVPEKARYQAYPLSLLKKRLRKLSLKGLKVKPEVFVGGAFSLKSGVDAVISRAKKSKTDLIAIQTHGRKGFVRFMVGSFAETLLHRSPISILALNPKTTVSSSIQRILFATDLSPRSSRSLQTVCELAQSLGAELTVLHIPDPSYSVHYKGQDKSVETYRKSVRSKMERISEAVSAMGITVETVIEGRWGSIPELIAHRAKSSKADLVAVHSKTGSVAALFLGSVARGIVRSSEKPVFIVRG